MEIPHRCRHGISVTASWCGVANPMNVEFHEPLPHRNEDVSSARRKEGDFRSSALNLLCGNRHGVMAHRKDDILPFAVAKAYVSVKAAVGLVRKLTFPFADPCDHPKIERLVSQQLIESANGFRDGVAILPCYAPTRTQASADPQFISFRSVGTYTIISQRWRYSKH